MISLSTVMFDCGEVFLFSIHLRELGCAENAFTSYLILMTHLDTDGGSRYK